jgi:hypothetical protein
MTDKKCIHNFGRAIPWKTPTWKTKEKMEELLGWIM